MNQSRIIYLVIAALVIISGIMIFMDFNSSSYENIPVSEATANRQSADDLKLGSAFADNGINLVGILLFAAAAGVIIFSLINVFSNPKAAVRLLITLGILAVIVLLGYILATDEVTSVYIAKGVDTAGQSRWIGGVMNTVYIMGAIAIGSAIFSEIAALFK